MRYSLCFSMLVLGLAVWRATGSPPQDEDREQRNIQSLEALLEKNPRPGLALKRLYDFHLERGSADALLKKYAERTRQDPRDGTAWMILGLLEALRGRDAAAVAALTQAELLRRSDALAPYYLGQSLLLDARPADAAAAFERALARRPAETDFQEISQALGRVYQRLQQTDKALAVWKRLEQQFPEKLHVLEQIATTMTEEGQLEEALRRWEALTQKTRDFSEQVRFRLEAAELKVRLGKRKEALGDLEQLLGKLNPERWPYPEVRRRIEHVFLREGDHAGLTAYYQEWLASHGDDYLAMEQLARALLAQGRTADAESWLRKAIKVAPTRRELRLALIDRLTRDQKLPDAIVEYQALNEVAPNQAEYLAEWGRLVLRDTSRPEAERRKATAAIWRRLLDAQPKDAGAASRVAELFREAGGTEEALACYRKAVELAPAEPQHAESLGEFLHGLKRADEARAAWRQIAEGKNRNARSLTRLAEILYRAGFSNEAIEAHGEACDLEPDDLGLRFAYADLLHQAARHADAQAQLDRAASLAIKDEDFEALLQQQIRNVQANNTLDQHIARLETALNKAGEHSPREWYRLARYFEGGRRGPEALRTIERVLKLDPKSIPAWLTAARLHESAGDLTSAVEAQRRLVAIDRPRRVEYLTNIARLESRLGRKKEALATGRELLDASLGSLDACRAFAQMCFQFGAAEEGFEALRRAVRANASDPQARLALAGALADQFRTTEAIDLFWQAYERADDLDSKLGIVVRLTELHMQRNQFDRLTTRLRQERGDAEAQRRTIFCLSQAYHTAGDFAAARRELERLLTEPCTDPILLHHLAVVAEKEEDLPLAAGYQRRLCKLAPMKEREARLAQLLSLAGQPDEAATIWLELARRETEPRQLFQSLDFLLLQGKHEHALLVTGRVLQQRPNDWEILYREGVALAKSGKSADAVQRFQRILDLRLSDDDLSALQAFRKARLARASPAATTAPAPRDMPLKDRMEQAQQIQEAVSGPQRRSSTQPSFWSPADFGQARMAALAWQYSFALKQNRREEFLKRVQPARDSAESDLRGWWDCFYFQLARPETTVREIYEAAQVLSRSDDLAAKYAYLNALSGRSGTSYSEYGSDASDATPPLPAEELDHVLACYQAIRREQPGWLTWQVVPNVLTELRRANRKSDEDRLYRESLAAATGPAELGLALSFAVSRKDQENTLILFKKLRQMQPGPTSSRSHGGPASEIASLMRTRVAANAEGDAFRLLDGSLAVLRQAKQAPASAAGTANQPLEIMVWRRQGNTTYGTMLELDFPPVNDRYGVEALVLLRGAYDCFYPQGRLQRLIEHFQTRLVAATPAERIHAYLGMAYLWWWADEKEQATHALRQASALAPGDASLGFQLAHAYEKQGQPQRALALLDTIVPTDTATLQRRELAALTVAAQAGQLERGRQAAERLFGLPLDAAAQTSVASHLHNLGLHELAQAVGSRLRKQNTSRPQQLLQLMAQYEREGKLDLAANVAHQVVQTVATQPSTFRSREEANPSAEATRFLSRTGKLDAVIAQTEEQLKASPKAYPLYQTLSAYYRAARNQQKLRDLLKRMIELRPDDPQVRFEAARQLHQAGQIAEALEQYKIGERKDAGGADYSRIYELVQVFRQANKLPELGQLAEELDWKGHFATEVVEALLAAEATHAQGMRLFDRVWRAR